MVCLPLAVTLRFKLFFGCVRKKRAVTCCSFLFGVGQRINSSTQCFKFWWLFLYSATKNAVISSFKNLVSYKQMTRTMFKEHAALSSDQQSDLFLVYIHLGQVPGKVDADYSTGSWSKRQRHWSSCQRHCFSQKCNVKVKQSHSKSTNWRPSLRTRRWTDSPCGECSCKPKQKTGNHFMIHHHLTTFNP